MTQSQFAERIGKGRSFISKVENDGQNLTLATLYDIVSKGPGMSFKVEIVWQLARIMMPIRKH